MNEHTVLDQYIFAQRNLHPVMLCSAIQASHFYLTNSSASPVSTYLAFASSCFLNFEEISLALVRSIQASGLYTMALLLILSDPVFLYSIQSRNCIRDILAPFFLKSTDSYFLRLRIPVLSDSRWILQSLTRRWYDMALYYLPDLSVFTLHLLTISTGFQKPKCFVNLATTTLISESYRALLRAMESDSPSMSNTGTHSDPST